MRTGGATEIEIQAAIRAAFAHDPGVVMWRNNSGVAHGHVRYGLCPGASDLLGIIAPSGRWLALEVKRPGQPPSPEQVRFLQLVRRMGGFAAVVHTVAEARDALARARAGASS